MEATKKCFILSFDGGGVRVVLQYMILKRIIKEFPDLLNEVTIFAGTSAGSILASALAANIENLDSLISKENMQLIFESSTRKRFSSIYGLTRSKYSNEKLKGLLEKYFQDIAPSTLTKGLYIPTFRVDGKNSTRREEHDHGQHCLKPKWLNPRVKRWHSVYHHNLTSTAIDQKLVESILESTAAPYYFPIHNGCIDGGICNNNPSLSVVTKLLSLGRESKTIFADDLPEKFIFPLEDIYVLSIGSGEKPSFLKAENDEWGFLRWAPHLLDAVFDGNAEVTSQQLYDILGDRFWRVQPVLDKDVPLDDASQYEYLVNVAKNFDLTRTFGWLEKF